MLLSSGLRSKYCYSKYCYFQLTLNPVSPRAFAPTNLFKASILAIEILCVGLHQIHVKICTFLLWIHENKSACPCHAFIILLAFWNTGHFFPCRNKIKKLFLLPSVSIHLSTFGVCSSKQFFFVTLFFMLHSTDAFKDQDLLRFHHSQGPLVKEGK